ncbi:hypothetical protein GE061_019855 [Apolygus lucorum]|uniref:Uncharacterized protein n=1 Tax=Apolygus lucorum TaxID=248454 RepID=A0A8S9X9K0_APOLU|nr:hypothetical protein GE061_019855 [Apolygus lucorum]
MFEEESIFNVASDGKQSRQDRHSNMRIEKYAFISQVSSLVSHLFAQNSTKRFESARAGGLWISREVEAFNAFFVSTSHKVRSSCELSFLMPNETSYLPSSAEYIQGKVERLE